MSDIKKRYILQKDINSPIGSAKAGTIGDDYGFGHIWFGTQYWNKETCDANPDWFLPEQPEVINEDIVWNDRLLSVAEVMAASELVGEWNDNDLAYKFRRNNLIEIARRNFFNKTEQPKEWEIVREDYVGEGSHKQILSVRRVSDGEVFSVGDEVQHMEEKTDAGRITSFTLHAGIMVAYFKGDNGHEYYFNDISVINKKSNSKYTDCNVRFYKESNQYTKKELDEAIQEAFEAARELPPIKYYGGVPLPGHKYPTFQDYINSLNPNSKTVKHWP